MHLTMRRSSTAAAGWRSWLIALIGAAALIVPGVATSAASAETTWLCKPGLASNPCLSSEEATVQLANGSSFVEHAQPAANPPIDCFYVYPTVSSQFTINANEEIDPEETQIAIDSGLALLAEVQRLRADLSAADDPGAQRAPGNGHQSKRGTGLRRRAGGDSRNTWRGTTTAAASSSSATRRVPRCSRCCSRNSSKPTRR